MLVLVKETGLISRFKGQDILDLRKLQYDLQKNVRSYMWSKGYFQARLGDPVVEGLGLKRTDFLPLITLPLPFISSKDDTLRIIVPVTEGKVYRVGELKVEGNSIFSEQQILAYVGLKTGEIADGKRLQDAVYEDLKNVYGAAGIRAVQRRVRARVQGQSREPERRDRRYQDHDRRRKAVHAPAAGVHRKHVHSRPGHASRIPDQRRRHLQLAIISRSRSHA